MQNLYGFAKPYMKFDKDISSLSLEDDQENSRKLLGLTGYYSPQDYSVTLYTTNRHPKDILRSFAHELVHHMQNCEGQFDDGSLEEAAEEGYAQRSKKLREMEEQAYRVGNLCFRDWEDGIKKRNKETIYISEGKKRYVELRDDEGIMLEVYDDEEKSLEESPEMKFRKVDLASRRLQQTQEDSDFQILTQEFESSVVPELSKDGVEFKGFYKFDSSLERKTIAAFRMLNLGGGDFHVARIKIDLDPLSKRYGVSLEKEGEPSERFFNKMYEVLSYIKRSLNLENENSELNLRESKGKMKAKKKITTEQIKRIVERHLRSLNESKKKLGRKQIQEMIDKVVQALYEQDDKSMSKAKKPAGSLVKSDIDQLINEVLSEYDDYESADDFSAPTDYDMAGADSTGFYDGNPRAGDELASYEDELGEWGADEDVIPPTPEDDLVAEPEPNWLYDDEEASYADTLYERCGSRTKDRLHENRNHRLTKKLIGWATR